MIEAALIFNYHGKPRLSKFYESDYTPEEQKAVIKAVYQAVSNRPDSYCNFVSTDGIPLKGDGLKLVYRHYATLYVVMIVDQTESSLAILDLIQTFVEGLNKVMENVCELDMVLNTDRVVMVLDELIMGGMVSETTLASLAEVMTIQKRMLGPAKPPSGKK
ncbi:Adaptor Protein Complex 3 subunit sigma (AP3S1) [Carpediemonas membranifera]|uniref:AP complex subunit sigma n=1 Tax=Carpediemonas membranifera TaxID=201153 RepID=A0A8J6B080_9EUKA|nr:Adaptor Protein Complex 3 subunit sigma (AP3S1) [Carpediemonas membranifera]|eukprot:KAG9390182.1 Adaptor Protein Complex 3 subunit sigma (AP3S1) [Carpediemonas membranifera]